MSHLVCISAVCEFNYNLVLGILSVTLEEYKQFGSQFYDLLVSLIFKIRKVFAVDI